MKPLYLKAETIGFWTNIVNAFNYLNVINSLITSTIRK